MPHFAGALNATGWSNDALYPAQPGRTGYGRGTHVADDGQVGQHVQDLEPDADVLGALRDWPPRLAHQLVRVQPDLHPVVEQREQRRKRERRHEDGDEAELQNWNKQR